MESVLFGVRPLDPLVSRLLELPSPASPFCVLGTGLESGAGRSMVALREE